MSLTNVSSMVALSTLRGINKNLEMVQGQISTGKKVANARDNAAVYAITSVMNSDVKGFEAIGSSLALGSSTVAVARSASEDVNNLLQEIKGSIVAAQEENVDRTKIQEDISRLRDQITTIVGSAQFNGLNLLDSTDGTDSIGVLASLDRASDQSVTSSDIVVSKSDLTQGFGDFGSTGDLVSTVIGTDNPGGSGLSATNQVSSITFTDGSDSNFTAETVLSFDIEFGDQTITNSVTIAAGTAAATGLAEIRGEIQAQLASRGITDVTVAVNSGAVEVTNASAFNDLSFTNVSAGAAGDSDSLEFDNNGGTGLEAYGASGANVVGEAASTGTQNRLELVAGAFNEGDGIRIQSGGLNIEYVAKAGDTGTDVANGLNAALNRLKSDNPNATDIQALDFNVVPGTDPSADNAFIQIDAGSNTQTLTISATAGGTAAGGLALLAGIDVSTSGGAADALRDIESLIQTSIDAASQFGSAQRRIDIQSDFIQDLTDSFKAGIGALVDADLEAASAELQSLQVQQQLGIQALSIANQSPQTLLSLFR
ncbi:MAG: flagellin [Pseudomonadota bacterium]